MEIKHIFSFNRPGLATITFMAQVESNLPLIKLLLRMFLFMCPICKDLEVVTSMHYRMLIGMDMT